MIAAVGPSRRLAGGLHRRQQNCGQNTDDRDDHQQLDEGEARGPRPSVLILHGRCRVINEFPTLPQSRKRRREGHGKWPMERVLSANRLLRGHCPSQRAAGHALVGLLAPELRPARPSRRSINRGNGQTEMGQPHFTRLQRRGRSGFAPEFPVRRLFHESSRPPTHVVTASESSRTRSICQTDESKWQKNRLRLRTSICETASGCNVPSPVGRGLG